MSKMVYAHSEILPSLKKEILTSATIWVNLEDILLSEILYDSTCVKYLESLNSGTENRTVVSRGWKERGMGSWCLKGPEFHFGMRK